MFYCYGTDKKTYFLSGWGIWVLLLSAISLPGAPPMTLARVLHFRFSCFSLKMGLRKIVWGGGRCSMFFSPYPDQSKQKKRDSVGKDERL